MPAQDWPPQDAAAFPVKDPCFDDCVDLMCTTIAGTPELCGAVEMASPSTPPKKYRTMALAGTYIMCGPFSSTKNVLSGECSLGAADCEPVEGGILDAESVSDPGEPGEDSCPCGDAYGTAEETVLCSSALFEVGLLGFFHAEIFAFSRSSLTLGPTTLEMVGLETCLNELAVWGTVNGTLTDEDTEAHAIARSQAAGTWTRWLKAVPSSCLAYYEQRTSAFAFAHQDVKWRVKRTGLTPATVYNVSVEVYRRAYGTMDAFTLYATQTEPITTDADGNFTLTALVPNDPGYETYVEGPPVVEEA